jgi:hypothetical protein
MYEGDDVVATCSKKRIKLMPRKPAPPVIRKVLGLSAAGVVGFRLHGDFSSQWGVAACLRASRELFCWSHQRVSSRWVDAKAKVDGKVSAWNHSAASASSAATGTDDGSMGQP